MAHEVFISYSTKDKAVAEAVCAALEAQKIRCWIAPRDVSKGTEWADAIPKAIKASTVMILIFSDHANRSMAVRREVRIATDNDKVIIPYRIEDVAVTGALEFYLPDIQWLDALTPET